MRAQLTNRLPKREVPENCTIPTACMQSNSEHTEMEAIVDISHTHEFDLFLKDP